MSQLSKPLGQRRASEGDTGALPNQGQVKTVPRVAVAQLSGAADGRITSVTSTEIIIGRSAHDLTVDLSYDMWVSRHHARITYRDGNWWLEDLGSANGTLLGEAREHVRNPTHLPLGVIFRVGYTDLMLIDDLEPVMDPISSEWTDAG